jgi:exodeoxyribonuclease V beta subunit
MSTRQNLDVTELPLSGVHLIEASAGTGKTYTIAALFLRLIVERELPIEQVLTVTFTTAATLELRARVADRLEQARRYFAGDERIEADAVLRALGEKIDRVRADQLLERALGNFDRAAIFTIHGFAARALGESAFELGAQLDLEVTPNIDDLIYDSVADFWAERVATLEPEIFAPLRPKLFEDLRKLARLVVASREVPWVDLEDAEAVVRNAPRSLDALRARFHEARKLFAERGEEARDVLLSGAVNRGTYSVEKVSASFEAWRTYFDDGEAEANLSVDCVRWAQSKVRERANKGRNPEHGLFVVLETLLEAHAELGQIVEARRAILLRDARDYLLAKVQAEHARARTQSFDDLLVSLHDALTPGADGGQSPALSELLAERYRVALIDEFQDTDATQYAVFRRLFAERREPGLFLIGDPKQSIYAFRGADIFSYLAAQNDADQVWTMPHSYRASPRLIAAQNALFGRVAKPFFFDEIRYEPMLAAPGHVDHLLSSGGDPVCGMAVIECDKGQNPLEQAAFEVAGMLASGAKIRGEPLSPRHLAVLCRTNAQAEETQVELARLGIPAVMHGDRSVFESAEATELRRALHGLIETGDRRAVRSALATRLFGLGVSELVALETDSATLEKWINVVRTLGETWRSRGIFAVLEHIFVELGATERLLSELGGERRVTNLRHLGELLHAEEATRHLGPLALFRFLEAAISDPQTFGYAPETRQIRLESDADAVVLTTVHKSKGLEYDIVILPTLGLIDKPWREPAFRFHTPRREERVEVRALSLAPESHDARLREHYAESMRLGYVAVTRARHHVRVVLAPVKKGFSSFRYWCVAPETWMTDPMETIGRLESLDEAEQHRLLARLAEASQGSLELVRGAVGPWRAGSSPVAATPLRFARLEASTEKRLERTRRTGSFSSIARAQRSEGRRIGWDVADVEGSLDLAVIAPESRVEALGSDFPRGAEAGQAIHLVFESMTFERGAAEQRRQTVREVLAQFGFERTHEEACFDIIERALETELPPGFRLAELRQEQRAPELEFNLVAGQLGRELNPKDLTAAVESAEFLPARYRQELRLLEFAGWQGYLRGFIDLTVEHQGKLYVIDYKSNFLGADEGSYESARLELAMGQHHYFLQGLLYAAAVHAHARSRNRAYDYEQNFGGVLYLFLRGMSPLKPGSGAFFFRPSARTLDGILHALRGGSA